MRLEPERHKIQPLRDEVAQLLADAIRLADVTSGETNRIAEETRAETNRVADATQVETDRVQHVHDDEMSAAQKDHSDELTALQDSHDEEMTATQQRHDAEMVAAQHVHSDERHNLDLALASRDVFGQAKGIIMATTHCDAATAFDLIRKQSQAENRKALDVAAEIVARVSRRAASETR